MNRLLSNGGALVVVAAVALCAAGGHGRSQQHAPKIPKLPTVVPSKDDKAKGKPILPAPVVPQPKPLPKPKPNIVPRPLPPAPVVPQLKPKPAPKIVPRIFQQRLQERGQKLLQQNQQKVVLRVATDPTKFQKNPQRAVVIVNNVSIRVNVFSTNLAPWFSYRWWNPGCGCYVYWSPYAGYCYPWQGYFYPIWCWNPGGPVLSQSPTSAPEFDLDTMQGELPEPMRLPGPVELPDPVLPEEVGESGGC